MLYKTENGNLSLKIVRKIQNGSLVLIKLPFFLFVLYLLLLNNAWCYCSYETRIRTTGFEKQIPNIKEDMLINTDEEEPVRVKKIKKEEAKKHKYKILKVVLNDTTILEISPDHTTAEGKKFRDLKMGDRVDGRIVVSTKMVPYEYKYVYDILPDSKTNYYYANGVLIKSGLK